MDSMVPFGLRSAPKIFNAAADVLEWCISKAGVEMTLQSLVFLEPSRISVPYRELGVPLAPEKQAGPSTTIEFLGITIDTVQ